MDSQGRRGRLAAGLEREQAIVALMIGLYCKGVHGRRSLPSRTGRPVPGPCLDCAALAAYARSRLAACPHGDAKPPCRRCETHCYRPEMRERMRAVMRYAGPRMAIRAPLAFLKHAAWLLRRRG